MALCIAALTGPRLDKALLTRPARRCASVPARRGVRGHCTPELNEACCTATDVFHAWNSSYPDTVSMHETTVPGRSAQRPSLEAASRLERVGFFGRRLHLPQPSHRQRQTDRQTDANSQPHLNFLVFAASSRQPARRLDPAQNKIENTGSPLFFSACNKIISARLRPSEPAAESAAGCLRHYSI